MATYATILTDDALTIYVDGRARVAARDVRNFAQILEAYKQKDYAKAVELMDKTATDLNAFGQGKVTVVDGVIQYDGHAIHNVLTDKILKMMDEGFDVNPMVRFLENLLENPSKTAVNELYLFLEHGKLPITEDGHFLAYKKVRANFTDIHSGKFDNSPGKQPSMPRYQVDDNRDNTCSTGLHFCSIEYLPNFGSGPGNKVVIVKINPRDVVSIPSDYNNTKGRASTYLVLEEYTGPLDNKIFEQSVWTGFNEEEQIDEEDSWDSWEEELDEDSWEDEGELSVLSSFGITPRVQPKEDNTSLDGGSFIAPTVPVHVTKSAAKPVMHHLIGEVRELPTGVRYKIIGTSRERIPAGQPNGGKFTGAVLIDVQYDSGKTEQLVYTGVAEHHPVIEHIVHPGAHMKPDAEDGIIQRNGQHIAPTELARSSLAEDLERLNKNFKPTLE